MESRTHIFFASILLVAATSCGRGQDARVAESDVKSLSSPTSHPVFVRDHFPPPPGHVEKTELGSCLQIPQFEEATILPPHLSPKPNTYSYDHAMTRVTVFQITSYNGQGQVMNSQRLNTCKPEIEHFEISDAAGNRDKLVKRIQYRLRTLESSRCPATLACF